MSLPRSCLVPKPIAEEASFEEEVEEEEEEPLDVRVLQLELEMMRQRVEELQAKLKMELEICPEEPCVDFEVELNCSEHAEICALQRASHKLHCQIKELVECCHFTKSQISEMQDRICRLAERLLQLQKWVAQLETWRRTLQHEFGLCIERFEYLKHVKAEWKDVNLKIAKQAEECTALIKTFVPKNCFVQTKNLFTTEISKMGKVFNELLLIQKERFLRIEHGLEAVENDESNLSASQLTSKGSQLSAARPRGHHLKE